MPVPLSRRNLLKGGSAALAAGALGLSWQSSQADEDPPVVGRPLSASGQAFVQTLRTFTTIVTSCKITPWRGGRGSQQGLLHIRHDGKLAYDVKRRARLSFDGTRFMQHAPEDGRDANEIYPEFVALTNLLFQVVRSGQTQWTGNGPNDYGLYPNFVAGFVDGRDIAELHIPLSVATGVRVFFVLKDGVPTRMEAFQGTTRISHIMFYAWEVNVTLPPLAFDPEGPPFELEWAKGRETMGEGWAR